MPLYLPDFSEIMAVAETRGEDSDAPHLWRGLVGAWPLQEPGGATAFDVSGYGRHGPFTTITAANRGIGERGRHVSFNGSGSITTSLALSTPYTISAWQMRTSGGSWPMWASAEGKTLQLGYYVGNNRDFYWSNRYFAGNYSTLGVWRHYAVVFDGARVPLYVDGVWKESPAYSPEPVTAFAISRPEYSFYGALNLVTVHNRVLTPAEIQQLYADPWAMYRLRTVVYPAAVAEPVLTYRNYILGGGVI